jgi:organic radical activating enzyme
MIYNSKLPIFLVTLFVTLNLVASENPIPTNLKQMQELSKKIREDAHKKKSEYHNLYNDRSMDIPKIPIENKIEEKLAKPKLKIQSISEDIAKSKEHLQKVTVPLPKDEESRYDSLPH